MDKEIIEGNRLIAEFFGAKYMGKYGFPDQMGYEFSTRPYAKEESIRTWYHPEALEFHSSWEWQVPVWVKMCSESLKRAMTESEAKRHNDLYENYSQCVAACNVMQAFKYLTEAIQWYNTQTKNS